MKYTDLINISISNIKSNKFKTIIFILIITLFMTLITCFFTFKNSWCYILKTGLDLLLNPSIIDEAKEEMKLELEKIE